MLTQPNQSFQLSALRIHVIYHLYSLASLIVKYDQQSSPHHMVAFIYIAPHYHKKKRIRKYAFQCLFRYFRFILVCHCLNQNCISTQLYICTSLSTATFEALLCDYCVFYLPAIATQPSLSLSIQGCMKSSHSVIYLPTILFVQQYTLASQLYYFAQFLSLWCNLF